VPHHVSSACLVYCLVFMAAASPLFHSSKKRRSNAFRSFADITNHLLIALTVSLYMTLRSMRKYRVYKKSCHLISAAWRAPRLLCNCVYVLFV
jgi:hypothetical protein